MKFDFASYRNAVTTAKTVPVCDPGPVAPVVDISDKPATAFPSSVIGFLLAEDLTGEVRKLLKETCRKYFGNMVRIVMAQGLGLGGSGYASLASYALDNNLIVVTFDADYDARNSRNNVIPATLILPGGRARTKENRHAYSDDLKLQFIKIALDDFVRRILAGANFKGEIIEYKRHFGPKTELDQDGNDLRPKRLRTISFLINHSASPG